jgi:hypothetical protein
LEFCICGDGTYIAPLVIWPTVRDDRIYKDSTKHRGIWIKYNKSGFISKDLFEFYCLNILIPTIIQKRKDAGKENCRSLLLLDSHSSRINKNLLILFANNSIDVLTFRYHSLHLYKPLDVGVSGKFKRKIGQSYKNEDNNKISFKKEVFEIIQSSIHSALSPSSIIDCFKTAGIIPFNPKTVLDRLPPGNSETLEHFQKKKERMRVIDIECKVITDPIFLAEFDD